MNLKEELKSQRDAAKSRGQPCHSNHSCRSSLEAAAGSAAARPGHAGECASATARGRAGGLGTAHSGSGRPSGPRWRRAHCAAGATRKLHLSRLSSPWPLSKWGFERLGSPGSALENGAGLFREAGLAHTCLPLRPSARVYREHKRKKTVWWVFFCTLPSLYLRRKRPGSWSSHWPFGG